MIKEQISLELARRIALNAQLLDGRTKKLPEGKDGIAQTIEKLGYIQIDTIAVIQRAHHHTLWTRRPDYDPEILHILQAKERRIFEYWTHANSFVPMSDYRYYLPRMRNFNDPKSIWAQQLLEKCDNMMQPVLERIRGEGPLSSKDFSGSPETKHDARNRGEAVKAALELLFYKGDLMITARRNFQKVYDLRERVLPESINTSFPDDDELGSFFVRRALSVYGVAREKEIRLFMQPETTRDSHFFATSKDVILKSLTDLVAAGKVIRLTIEEDKNTDYHALRETIEKSTKLKQIAPQVNLLSPFDNLITQRDRMKRLFRFDYVLECYVPPAKRKYGYFVLPILWGENLIGRLDPKVDRKKKTLIIRNLIFEPEFNAFDEFLPAFAEKLVDFTRFNHCNRIIFEMMSPDKIRTNLEHLLKSFSNE